MSIQYSVFVHHPGLEKNRTIKGSSRAIVEHMAATQVQQWDVQYSRKLEAQAKSDLRKLESQERQELLLHRNEWKEEAAHQTEEAQRGYQEVATLLVSTRPISGDSIWDELKDHSEYIAFRAPPRIVPGVVFVKDKRRPRSDDALYVPQLNLLDRLSKQRRENKENLVKELYQKHENEWLVTKKQTEVANAQLVEEYKSEIQRAEAETAEANEAWTMGLAEFMTVKKIQHESIDNLRSAFHALEPGAVKTFFEFVLSKSVYPDSFPSEFEIEYSESNKILAIEYRLPSPDQLPRTKEFKYLQTQDELEEVFLSQSAFNELYDSVLYQITLRSMKELFDSDQVGAIDAICFNGWVATIDAGTGIEADACIISVLAQRSEFQNINIFRVDPKACFKKLRGVGGAKLHALSPVAPVMQIDRNDKRFVGSYSVTQNLSDSTNLAALPWEDFEHLIREIFSMEFSQNGGEVKVTQASRDGGVDAIAFDPDPIRGGKIVIQAKRYTNTVGVSAVRDLYGTMMNEGANKGILVTTSEFGPDAYEFAKGKPLTLLTGGNLLSLMSKHGHKARIDLVEAKGLASKI